MYRKYYYTYYNGQLLPHDKKKTKIHEKSENICPL